MVRIAIPRTNIIFILSYPEYFKDVYKVKHTYFLTKDFEKERFADAMSKVIRNINNNYVNFHNENNSSTNQRPTHPTVDLLN